MSESKIKLLMTGPEGDKELLPLKDFLRVLRVVRSGLEHLNNMFSDNKANKLSFSISNLSHSSPFGIDILVNDTKKTENIAPKAICGYIDGISAIEFQKDIPDYIDFQLFENMKELSRLKKKRFAELAIINTTSSVEITNELGSHIDVILGGDIVAFSSVRGMLESLNVHNDINKFYIYPSIGSNRIECKFDDNMFDKIKQGLKHYVNVKGKVFYKSISKYPYKIVADAIDIYPPENELSKLSELRGIEPGLTGDMTTEEFIRSIREESE